MEDIKMKKTYINPNLVVVKIATHQMLASSPDGTTNGLDPNASAIGAGDLDARGFDFDDDEY